MRRFEDSDRFTFPLTPDSLVVDAGAYNGAWAKAISDTYHCNILSFEPCKRSFDAAATLLRGDQNVILFHCGLGGSFRQVEFGVQNDSTGVFAAGMPRADGSFERETVQILPAVPQLKNVIGPGEFFALLKVNIENMEYELFEHILAEDAAAMFKIIIVQPHTNAPDYERRWAAIRAGLQRTHDFVAAVPWVWERYEIK